MKFVGVVEGQTEKEILRPFLQKWLRSQSEPGHAIQLVCTKGNSKFVKQLVDVVKENRTAPGHLPVAVFGLLDYQGLSMSYPRTCTTLGERCEWAKTHFESQVNDARFKMFFAVHDIEAWLFSQPKIFPGQIPSRLPRDMERPESINSNNPPSKLLESLYRKHVNHEYDKRVDGIRLFHKLDPMTAGLKCPQLQALLDDILMRATATK